MRPTANLDTYNKLRCELYINIEDQYSFYSSFTLSVIYTYDSITETEKIL